LRLALSVQDTSSCRVHQNQFFLGHSAMLVNEGCQPRDRSTREKTTARRQAVGVVGMGFKAESDDREGSLSYKLKKILQIKARRVLTTDPFVKDPRSCRSSGAC